MTPPSPRSIFGVTGTDACDFLQGMITNDMQLLSSQSAIYAALLTPQGKVISTFFVVNNPIGGFLIDCPQGASEALIQRLAMFRLRADVQFTTQEDLQILRSDEPIDGICFADPRHSKPGYRCLVAATQPAGQGSVDDHYTHMIAEQDLDYGNGEVFPTDINMDLQHGIAWRKGCYVGQEVVSRMKRRGNIRRRTGLAVFAQTPPPKGTEIFAGPARVGVLLSSHDNQALAIVRTDRAHKAMVDSVPFSAAGQKFELTLPEEQDK